jgi:DNA-binding SARP family transcriptional activator/class 3 adenylate cyclase
MEFRILGPLEAWEGGSPVALGGAKQRALLAVLLLYANEVVSTERLIDLLWEDPPAKATKAVQVYASRLRKALGGRVPLSRPSGYLLEFSPEQLDLTRFRRLREEARRDPSGAPEKLEEALALWRGQALAEFAGEPFALVERGRLEEERLEALEERIEAELALGRHAALVGELEALVATHPLRERPRRQLMLALYRCGRQAEALAAYREARRLLVEELGIEPGRALQQLEQAILRQDPALELVPSSAATPVPAPARPGIADEPSPPPEKREERKVVSVLFVELVKHVGRGAPADPEDVRPILRRFHKVVRQEIERFGGTIESVFGDALMAVFGALAHEDDPERAVRAALAIRRSVGETDDELQVRMSVDTGMALVSVDARPGGEPTTAGDVVGNARRLLVAAPVNGILVGDQTHRATLETIDYCATAPIEAGGIPTWEAVSARSRRGADLLRAPTTPLVGRERELALLASALDHIVDERSPQLVTLVGVPGIGKSRLVFELSKTFEHDRGQITWLQGRCLSYGDGVSFWALGEIVKAQAGILESDSPEQAEEKLRGAVAAVLVAGDEAAWVERELRPLIGAGGELRRGERLGEGFPAWRRFLDGLAELRPLVLVLEDLHWADEGLLEFVDELAARLRDAPLLLLCTARPELLERRPGWGGGKPNALTISLAPLSEDETERLASSVLGQPLLDAELQEALLARTGGNPLYVEQFARMFTEIGSLERLPETVHGIIAARLDGLLPHEKALLQDAAVVGKGFWSGAIESIGEVTRQQAEELLVALERKEFVQPARRSSVAGDSEYAFRHVLLRDVAYAQIPRAARADKHRRAARWIESLGRPDDHAEMLAHHYSSALEYTRAAGREDPALVERARLALRAAGDRAFAVASYATAAHFYGAALELWPNDPDRVWLLVHAGHARHAADGTGIDLLEQGFEQLRSGGNPQDAAQVAVEVARRFWLVGERDAAYTYIGRALELVEGRGDSRAKAYALVERAAYHMSATEHPQAIRLVREALPLTEALGMDDLHVRALDVLGSSRASFGDLGGLEDARRAVALARDRNAFYRLVVAELNLQGLLVFVGQLPAASEALRACRQDVERYGTADQRNWLRAVEAHEAVLYGHWNEAARILDERIAEAQSGVTHYSDPCCLALRASIALARGDLEAATSDSEWALEGARRIKDPQLLAPALTMRATVQLGQGQWEEASTLASEVLQHGAVLIPALLELHPTVTPIELAWLMRDLGREAEFLSVLELAPSTPWHDAARAIADGDFTHSVELVARIGAPSVDAYTRLRAAEELTRVGWIAGAHDHLEPALDFFRKVGAARYLVLAEALLAAP